MFMPCSCCRPSPGPWSPTGVSSSFGKRPALRKPSKTWSILLRHQLSQELDVARNCLTITNMPYVVAILILASNGVWFPRKLPLQPNKQSHLNLRYHQCNYVFFPILSHTPSSSALKLWVLNMFWKHSHQIKQVIFGPFLTIQISPVCLGLGQLLQQITIEIAVPRPQKVKVPCLTESRGQKSLKNRGRVPL